MARRHLWQGLVAVSTALTAACGDSGSENQSSTCEVEACAPSTVGPSTTNPSGTGPTSSTATPPGTGPSGTGSPVPPVGAGGAAPVGAGGTASPDPSVAPSGGMGGGAPVAGTGGAGGNDGAAGNDGTGGTGGDTSPGGTGGTGGAVAAGGAGGAGGNSPAEEPSIDIDEGPLTMWYDEPAGVWNEALPVGNGRLGAMVFGNPASERLQLNESTFWSGGPSRNDNPNALGALAEVRQLLFDGQYTDAESMINQNMTATALHGSMYQIVGNLTLDFPGHDNYTSYHRQLDLKRAVYSATYDVGGVTFTREVFASQPDQVIVVRLTASEPGQLTLSVGMDSPLQDALDVLDANTLEMTGTSSTHEGVNGQVQFDARVKVETSGGSTAAGTDSVEVTAADEVVLLVSIATNFTDYSSLSADEVARASEYLAGAEGTAYEDLLSTHIDAYQTYFNRVALNLGDATSSLPTDERIAGFAGSDDRDLVAMYYQFGRYLLISSSQPGGQPANLQGIWNGQTNPAWDSKYTININAEMNYWPAEKCNLSELHEPLLGMVEDLSQTGQQTAQNMYGADGWVAHHNTDIWRISGVVDGAFWGMWPMGGAWLSQHLWERYIYTGDLEFLEWAYPIMRSACEFYQDFLIEEPGNQWLVVSPSISPENAPANNGTSVVYGATMDNQLLFDLFDKTIRAAELLGQDAALVEDFQGILDQLPPMQVGSFGQLQEWLEDWDNPDDQHRHVSHLYGLYPSSQISPYQTPELFDAARTTLIHRGDVSTGWSMGWKVNFWARLLDGDHALELIRDQLTLVDPVTEPSGGTFPNFFDSHPPFQIDGNFGCTAGIAEMLLQSHDGAIHVLPALPADWAGSGAIKGLKAYGGFEVSFDWTDGEIQNLVIHSGLGGNLRLRVPNEVTLGDGTALTEAVGENPNTFFETPGVKAPLISPAASLSDVGLTPTLVYDLPTEAGATYRFVAN